MYARCVGHPEPACKKAREDTEIATVGSLAQEDTDDAHDRVARDAEQGAHDTEGTYEVVAGLAPDLVTEGREADTATRIGQRGSREDCRYGGYPQTEKQHLLLGNDGQAAADIGHEHEPDGPPFLAFQQVPVPEVRTAVFLGHVRVLAEKQGRPHHHRGIYSTHDVEHVRQGHVCKQPLDYR